MNQTDIINGRFKSAPWYDGCKNEVIYMVGLGGIGSNALYNLTKTIPCTYMIQDFDTVEDCNVGTQFYNKSDIGQLKVTSSLKRIKEYNPEIIVQASSDKYSSSVTKPIMIAALDNMKTRQEMFNAWKLKDDREIYIDARLRANFYEIFTVTPGLEEDYERTLFNDDEVDSAPCTYKSTSYFGMLCGARITHILVNYLSNKYSQESIYSVPFEIREFGDLMYFETK